METDETQDPKPLKLMFHHNTLQETTLWKSDVQQEFSLVDMEITVIISFFNIQHLFNPNQLSIIQM